MMRGRSGGRVRRLCAWMVWPVGLTAAAFLLATHMPVQSPGRLTDWPGVEDDKLGRTFAAYGKNHLGGDYPDDTRRPARGLPVHLTMTQHQWVRFQTATKRTQRSREEIFVAFGDGVPRTAVASVHGWSTQSTSRKSFGVRLFKDQHMQDDCDLRRFFLINMLYDKGMFRMRYSYRLLAGLGLFPSYHDYVPVYVNGMPQGIYLLVERPEDAVRRTHPEAISVIRRRWHETPEVKYAAPQSDPGALYRRLLHAHETLQGEALGEEIDRCLDLDQYMLWLAFNSLVRNGDSLDEVFFYAVPSAAGFRFEIAAWDYDDIMKPAAHRAALQDSLLYAAESVLDAAIQATPALYARYRETLRRVLYDLLPEDRLLAELDSVRREVEAVDTGLPPERVEHDREQRREHVQRFAAELVARHRELRCRLEAPDPGAPLDVGAGAGRTTAPHS